MHFTNLLVASALTIAPAVYGYGVAHVEIAYHDGCHNGDIPHNDVDTPESAVATEDSCAQLPAHHEFDIDAYSFSVTPITKDTTHRCYAVGVFSNEACVGYPVTVLPFWDNMEEAESRCIQDDYFDKYVSVKLLCDKKHDDEHEDEHKDEHGDEHGDEHQEGSDKGYEEEGYEEQEGQEGQEQYEGGEDERQGAENNPLAGLGL